MKTVLHLHPKSADRSAMHGMFHDSAQWQEARLTATASKSSAYTGRIHAMPQVAASSVDAVFSRDDLIYLTPAELAAALREIRRVLNAGGQFICYVPDAQWAGYQIALDAMNEPITGEAAPIPATSPLVMLYAPVAKALLPWPNAQKQHLFTARYLAKLLLAAGFLDVSIQRGTQNNLLALAYAPAKDETRQSRANVSLRHPYHLQPATPANVLRDDLDAEPQM